MKKRIRIQIIGNYLDPICYSLNRAGIYTEDIIRIGNPLGFVSIAEDNITKRDDEFSEDIKTINSIITQLTIKKNLNEYLSHDEKIFNSNIIEYESGKTVRYKNTSSYVIICNNNLLYPLFLYKGSLYSDTFPKNGFTKYLLQKRAINTVSSPCFSDIKKYFDKYIEILLNEYDKKHIILIKTAPFFWRLENGEFKESDNRIIKLQEFLNEADNYFIDKTNCAVVNTLEKCVPNKLLSGNLSPGVFYPKFVYDELSEDIILVIHDIEKQTPAIGKETEFNPLLQYTLLSSDNKTEFLQFLCEKNNGNANLSIDDIKYIEKYSASEKIGINEIIGIYNLSKKTVSCESISFNKTAFHLLYNNNCPVVVQSLYRYKKNKEYLRSYPFFSGSIPENQSIYFKINNQYIFGILPEQDVPFQLIQFSNKDIVDESKVIDSGYCCSINEAEALCRSIRFYVQRAKRGEGNHPIKLTFESEEVFKQSLCVLDYEYLLSNEPFLIGVEVTEAKDFSARTNLEFLFDKKTRIVRICNGLADQIKQYLFSKCIQFEGLDVFYDDLPSRSVNAQHLGFELDKITHEDIDKKCFSTIFSNLLVKQFDTHEKDLPEVLFEAGVYQLLGVSENLDLFISSGYKKCSRLLYTIKPENGYENLKYYVRGFGPYLTFYTCVVKPEILLLHYPLCLHQLCEFSAFNDEINSRLQQEMGHCAVIGVHVRRGDMTMNGETDQDYYKESICKILSIPEYQDAIIYVFSDDISWCRKHAESLGLLQVNRERLTFISHNKGDDSFRDMQLLGLCKVIIGQQGGFARMAYLLSDKSEIYITPNKKHYELLERIGKGNKYDIS